MQGFCISLVVPSAANLNVPCNLIGIWIRFTKKISSESLYLSYGFFMKVVIPCLKWGGGFGLQYYSLNIESKRKFLNAVVVCQPMSCKHITVKAHVHLSYSVNCNFAAKHINLSCELKSYSHFITSRSLLNNASLTRKWCY